MSLILVNSTGWFSRADFFRSVLAVCSLLLLSLYSPTDAYAACSSPAGVAGQMLFDSSDTVMKYCDSTNWIEFPAHKGAPHDGLIGYWKFDEGSGTAAADTMGNGDGTLYDGAGWGAGQVGGALSLDGVDDHVEIANEANFDFDNTDPFTISAWVYWETDTKNGTIWSKVVTGNGLGLVFYLDDAGGSGSGGVSLRFRGHINGSSHTYMQVKSANDTVSLNNWHHVVATYDGSEDASGISIYVDGVARTLNVQWNSLSTSILTDTPAVIGANYHDSGGWNFDGFLDDVRVYNRELSAQEVVSLYTATGGSINWPTADISSNLVGHWAFDEGSGTTVADSAGSHDGTTSGSPAWVSGQINGALNFDGVDDDVNISHHADFNITDEITLAAWVYPEAQGQSGHSRIISKRNDAGGNDVYALMVGNGGGTQIMFRIQNVLEMRTNANLPLNTWSHVVGTYDGSNMRVYLNGTEDIDSPRSASGAISTSSIDLRLGSRYAEEASRRFEGSMDDVRVYSRALTAADVAALYETVVPNPDCTSPAGDRGTILYDSINNVLNYCNGLKWVESGPNPGTGGAGCSSPSGVAGMVLYDSSANVMTYCDGGTWQRIGK